MDRRELLALLANSAVVAASGPARSAFAAAASGRVTDADVHAEIDRRLVERVDYVAILRGPISSREPGLADRVQQALDRDPSVASLLETLRVRGLQRLRQVDLPPDVKMLTLRLELEKILHEISTCLDHFLGVYLLLDAWGFPREAALVGLFHAVYGTEFNHLTPLDARLVRDRDLVRRVLGPRTEELVYLYGTVHVEKLVCGVSASGLPATSRYDILRCTDVGFTYGDDFTVLANALIANKYEPYVAAQDLGATLPILAQGAGVLLQELSGAFEPLRPFVSAGARLALDERARVGAGPPKAMSCADVPSVCYQGRPQ